MQKRLVANPAAYGLANMLATTSFGTGSIRPGPGARSLRARRRSGFADALAL
jgi:hypothetical protein